MDTGLCRDLVQRSGCEGLFVVGWAEVVQRGVAASVVVEGDPAEHVAAGAGLGCPPSVVDVEFTLEGGEERLGQDVVDDEPIRPIERRTPRRRQASA